MKMLVKLILALAIIFLLASCSYLSTFEYLAKESVAIYCSAPESARTINRVNANRIIFPNKIEITCLE